MLGAQIMPIKYIKALLIHLQYCASPIFHHDAPHGNNLTLPCRRTCRTRWTAIRALQLMALVVSLVAQADGVARADQTPCCHRLFPAASFAGWGVASRHEVIQKSLVRQSLSSRAHPLTHIDTTTLTGKRIPQHLHSNVTCLKPQHLGPNYHLLFAQREALVVHQPHHRIQ